MASYTSFTTGAGKGHAPVSDTTSFDGYRFSDYNVVVERVYDPLPAMSEEMADRVGAHGAYARGLYLGSREITLECRVFYDKWSDYEDIRTELCSFLYTTEDKRLRLRNHPNQYYMAHYSSMEEGDRDDDSCGITLKFNASNPLRYEDSERVLVVREGEQVQFEVGGTDEAQLKIEIRNSSGVGRGLISMAAPNNERFYSLYLMEQATVHYLVYDCVTHRMSAPADVGGEYIAEAGGRRYGVALDADWPILTPGKWAAYSYDGTATLTWRQSYR